MHPLYIVVFCALAFVIAAADDEPGYFVDERATAETPGYGSTVFTNVQDAINKADADSKPRVITIRGAADPFGAQFEEPQDQELDKLFGGITKEMDAASDAADEDCLRRIRTKTDPKTGERITRSCLIGTPGCGLPSPVEAGIACIIGTPGCDDDADIDNKEEL